MELTNGHSESQHNYICKDKCLVKRWKHLPWLLQELTIDAKDFLHVPLPRPVEAQHIDVAMALLTKAIRSFLATHQREARISILQLKLYLVDNYSDTIPPLLSEAIGIGTVKDLDLSIVDEESENCNDNDEDFLQQASFVDGFFRAYPGVLDCLTRLSLYNVFFTEKDMNHILFGCCKQLQHLYLSNLDTEGLAAWKIHALDSNLITLELEMCYLGKLEVLHLPKLEQLRWDGWICPNAPCHLVLFHALGNCISYVVQQFILKDSS